MTAFQVLFGLAVFAFTRDYYLQDTNNGSAHGLTLAAPASGWPLGVTETNIARLSAAADAPLNTQDPFELSRQADEFFANQQYARAAEAYEQLLALDPNAVDIYNNLGLTLQYLGRSAEALRWLNEGVALKPDHQRIWLTLGYVNNQVGNIEEARAALTTASQVGDDESIRQSAMRMLEALP